MARVLNLLIVLVLAASWPAGAQEAKPTTAQPAAEPTIDDTEEVIFERVTGWYVEGRGGMMFTVGGARGYSNAQPFYGFEFGYDITDRLSVQFGYASGYQAANPLLYPEDCTGDNCTAYHLDFGLTFFNLSADYDILHGERWAFEGRLGGGVVVIDPTAKPGQAPVDGDFFAGLRFEYYTLLRHFTLAVEYDFFYTVPTAIPAMAASLSIIYNF